MKEDAIEGRLTEMDDTQGSGQEGGNDNPQMTELRNMVQMLVGAVTAQQQLVQQHFQPQQPQETRELDLNRAETQQGETLYSADAKCSEFEHLKQLGTTIANYEGSFTNLAEYAPHLVAMDEMRTRRFEDGLRHEIKRVIRPLVLPTYAEVLDRAIIVEQDEIERKKYFDSKRRQNFGGEGTSGQKKQKPEMKSRNLGITQRGKCRCFHCNEVGHIKRNCPRLRIEAIAPRGGPRGGNARSGGNRPGNSRSRGGNVNNQRQGRAFALMPRDARNTDDVVAEWGYNSLPR
ncbi:hypothetical protein Acr_05g0012250 [Actinidia rufa]|uniref:CCHC-type domain-containing protein n=1 Tax=Actinidia rufa TaxID=165716 RepID=A0A7J0EN54_9ERIC|nr:hypothetical protein Acr_05g0012250 [Actinidia rufa]